MKPIDSDEELEARKSAEGGTWRPNGDARGNGEDSTNVHEQLPLFQKATEAEPYPADSLGPFLSKTAEAIASKVQVPFSVAAQSVLAVASLATCSHADVVQPFGQARPISLFLVTVAGTGDRKTTSDKEALRPVVDHEENLREENIREMRGWKVDHAVWTAEKNHILSDKKLTRSEKTEKLTSLGPEPEKPLAAFMKSGDITIEGLTKNWASAQPALGIFTSEGGTFTAGHSMNEDNALKTAAALSDYWDGSTVTRIRADEALILRGRRLSMHVMVQPDAAAAFFCNKVLRNQGFLSRVLIAAPGSLAGYRPFRPPSMEDEVTIETYSAHILRILGMPPKLSSGARNELAPRRITLSKAAIEIWCSFHDHVELSFRHEAGSEGIRDIANKAAENATRIAAVVELVSNINALEVGEAAMTGGAEIAQWSIGEALRVRETGQMNPKLLQAQTLFEWLKARPDDKIRFREILQYGPNSLRTKAELNRSVDILIDHGMVCNVSIKPRILAIL